VSAAGIDRTAVGRQLYTMVPTLPLPSQLGPYHPGHLTAGFPLAAAGLLGWPIMIYACVLAARLSSTFRLRPHAGLSHKGEKPPKHGRIVIAYSDASRPIRRRNRRSRNRANLRLAAHGVGKYRLT